MNGITEHQPAPYFRLAPEKGEAHVGSKKMKKTLTVGILLCAATFHQVAASERIPALSDRSDTPVIAVWREDWGLLAGDSGPFVITAVWSDGTSLWSTNDVRGGTPYYQATLDVAAVSNTICRIKERGAFSSPFIRKNNFGPDSFCTVVFVRSGTNTFFSRSWHELAEENPKAVAASYGLTSLGKTSREDFLKTDDPDYLKYRQLWTQLRHHIRTLVPKEGQSVEDLDFKLKQESFQQDKSSVRGKPRR